MSAALEVSATGAAAHAVTAHVPTLVAEGFAGRLFRKDPTLWGAAAEPVASRRLGWVASPRSSRPLVGAVAALREELREEGLDRVVLCGTGGSSLAAEVICAARGVGLTVLDSSHPDQVRAALTDRLDRTLVVVSSKSGSTVGTDSLRRAFVAAFEAAGIDATQRIIVVTDPGSPLDESSRAAGYRVVGADPTVDGSHSALTAFGLVPSGLAGVDVGDLLDDAEAVADLLAEDDEANPALRLGAAIAGTDPLRDKLVLVDEGSGLPGFADWVGHLVAESTGKDGTGVLPVVVGDSTCPEVTLPPEDATVVRLTHDSDDEPPEGGPTGSEVGVAGTLGAQLLLWQAATAVAGRLLGINPFDQPDVEAAGTAVRSAPARDLETSPADAVDGKVEIRALGGDWLGDAGTVTDAVDALLTRLDRDRGYLAVTAYLDRSRDAALADVRRRLAIRTRRPVTFGWGPRFPHPAGRLQGGAAVGVHIQLTGAIEEVLPVPGQQYTFGELSSAQAAGHARVLAAQGRPVLRLHLTDPSAVATVAAALA